MTLRRTGSRALVTPGGTYRWLVRGRPTYAQALAESPFSFVVERGRPAGAPLHVRLLTWAHPGNWVGAAPTGVVTPRLVRTAVDTALQRGWDPARPGPAFRLDLDERCLDPFRDPPR